jgi:hypothetical protein
VPDAHEQRRLTGVTGRHGGIAVDDDLGVELPPPRMCGYPYAFPFTNAVAIIATVSRDCITVSS